MPTQQKAKAKGKKIGRNKKWCERYRLNGTRLKNKIRRLRRHLRRYETDQRANSALTRLLK